MRFTVNDVPGRVKPPARLFCSIIPFLHLIRKGTVRYFAGKRTKGKRTKEKKKLKRLSHHLFTFLPQCFRGFCVERKSTHPFAHSGDDCVIRHLLADVAVLTVLPADLFRWRNHSSPHRRRGSLGNGFPLKRPLAIRYELLTDLFDHFFDLSRRHNAPAPS